MKFIFVLAFTVLITVSIGTIAKELKNKKANGIISPTVAGIKTTNDTVFTDNVPDGQYLGWPIFVNNYDGYKIRHPSEVLVKNSRNGDVSLIKGNTIDIFITQNTLRENDTINTVIESDINNKKDQLGNNFHLLNSISPIAIGSVTAQTYISMEKNQKVSSFYIPQTENKYLLVTCKTENTLLEDYQTAEKIIYSLELSSQ
jgi:hypothetical protein